MGGVHVVNLTVEEEGGKWSENGEMRRAWWVIGKEQRSAMVEKVSIYLFKCTNSQKDTQDDVIY